MPNYIGPLVLAIGAVTMSIRGAGFADRVLNYTPGTGVPAGYSNPTSALGPPSRITPGQFGGPVDPFNPPYLAEQVVAVGTGGSLTVGFDSPIVDDPSHGYGVDFIIFGNSGFQIVNGDFSGGGITDGSLFGANEGPTRVSVSSDGQTFYELSPSLAPVVDGPFPTEGSGDVFRPLDPSLKPGSFAGKDLAGIRQLYNASAGRNGFDIAWARTAAGAPANLSSISYIKIDVLGGVSEIDAVAAPEPGVVTLAVIGGAALLVLRRRA